MSDARSPERITRRPVPPLHPRRGAIRVAIVGEAPGPRGADQSLVPFWGDRAGRLVWSALRAAGLAVWNGPADACTLGGGELAARGCLPRVRGVLLTNAYDRCPTDDGRRFRAPTRGELTSASNVARLRGELALARDRGLRSALALGRVAASVVAEQLAAIGAGDVDVVALPHPSAQGLLMAAPGRGKGLRLADLEASWIDVMRKQLLLDQTLVRSLNQARV